jgi:Mg-chelatase subunit ChlD
MRTLHRSERRPRRGAVLVWILVAFLGLLGIAAIAIDVGYLFGAHSKLQAVADSASLAGGSGLSVSPMEARARAISWAAKNTVNGEPVVLTAGDIELGIWDHDLRQFVPLTGADEWHADSVRVTPRLSSQRGSAVPTVLAGMFGLMNADVSAQSVAFFGSRDIVVVLDYSASMNDDSELRHIDQIGRGPVEANLFTIYNQLGAPTFGSLQFTPVFVDPNAQATNTVAEVVAFLGLAATPYPYPAGSWASYVQYVRTNVHLQNAGYLNHYGYLTWVNYLLESYPLYAQTPDLWMTDEQPVTAVKDAVTVFLSYIEQVQTQDRVALVSYSYVGDTANVEVPFTDDLESIETRSRQLQAGHYSQFTNIGAGIQFAMSEIRDNGRQGAQQLIVLLTDGLANRPGDWDDARDYALAQTAIVADAGIPVLTISLGAEADVALMQEIADMTNGVHFNVPGGQSVSAYEADLQGVFRLIADHLPLRLVQ